jgi:hypothetical protein
VVCVVIIKEEFSEPKSSAAGEEISPALLPMPNVPKSGGVVLRQQTLTWLGRECVSAAVLPAALVIQARGSRGEQVSDRRPKGQTKVNPRDSVHTGMFRLLQCKVLCFVGAA